MRLIITEAGKKKSETYVIVNGALHPRICLHEFFDSELEEQLRNRKITHTRYVI